MSSGVVYYDTAYNNNLRDIVKEDERQHRHGRRWHILGAVMGICTCALVIAAVVLMSYYAATTDTSSSSPPSPTPTPTCVETCTYGEWSAWSPAGPCVSDPGFLTCSRQSGRTRNLTATCPVVPPPTTCTNVSQFDPLNRTLCTCPPVPVQCTSDAQCLNTNKCTASACVGGECTSTVITECLMPNPCTASTCNPDTGACDLSPFICPDDDDPCTDNTCQAGLGCTYPLLTTPAVFPQNPCFPPTCVGYNATTNTTIWEQQPLNCSNGTYCQGAGFGSSGVSDVTCLPECTSDANCSIFAITDKCYVPRCNINPPRVCELTLTICLGGFCNPDTGLCQGAPPSCGSLVCPTGNYINFSDCSCRCNSTSCNELTGGSTCTQATCVNPLTGSCAVSARNCTNENPCIIGQCVEGQGCVLAPKNCSNIGIDTACYAPTCNPNNGSCYGYPKDCNSVSFTGIGTCVAGVGCQPITPCPQASPCYTQTLINGTCGTQRDPTCCYTPVGSEPSAVCGTSGVCSTSEPGVVGVCQSTLLVQECLAFGVNITSNNSLSVPPNFNGSNVYQNGLPCPSLDGCSSATVCSNGVCQDSFTEVGGDASCGGFISEGCVTYACINNACVRSLNTNACITRFLPINFTLLTTNQIACDPDACPAPNTNHCHAPGAAFDCY